MEFAIETRDISHDFSRGSVKALSNVSLNVGKGSIFGLLGPNGAGKTTFVKILLSIIHQKTGQAKLFGLPTDQYTSREKAGYLPESNRFPGFLTGYNLLDYSARLSGITDSRRRRTQAEKVLKQVGMSDWGQTKIKKYSKGMAQRIGLAQALLHEPELIFLDEPTDGIDPVGRKEVRDLLINLKDEGKTIFLNSHLLSEVELICDEVAILHHGKLLKQGTVKELTTSEKRFKVYAYVPEDSSLRSEFKEETLSIVFADDSLDITVKDVESLNAVIDKLRSSAISINAIIPHTQTLEDSFIQTIQNDANGDFNTLLDEKEAGK